MTDENLSCANAWRSLEKSIKEKVQERQPELYQKVTEQLFEDGCYSAWVHRSLVVEALLDRIEELEDEVQCLLEKKDEAI